MKDSTVLILFVLGIFLVFTISGTITGNPVWGSTNPNTKVILDTLHERCHVTSFENYGDKIGAINTCSKLCSTHNEVCISGSFEEYRMENGKRYTAYTGDLVNCDYPMYPSSFGGTTTYSCMCCSLKRTAPFY